MNPLVNVVGILGAVGLVALVAWAGSQGSVAVSGFPLFALCAVLAVLIQWVVFVPSFAAHTEHYFDLTGSLTYISLVACALLLTEPDPRAVLIGVLVVVWAARLGSFLFLRVRADGEDRRFKEMKYSFLWFLMTWTIQGAWTFVTVAAGLAAMTSLDKVPLGFAALLGVLLWVAGFAIEVLADRQKRAFRADQSRQTDFITTGLWAWSRHPNYFGEILLWCGVALIALPALSGWQLATLISPLFVVLLLTQVSGIPMLERRADKKWGEDPLYQAYKQATPVLIPRPPSRA